MKLTNSEKIEAAAAIRAKFDEDPSLVKEQIAKRMGIDTPQVWQWVDGRRPVPAQWAEMFAAEIGLRPEDVSPAYRRQGDTRAQYATVGKVSEGLPKAAVNDHVGVRFWPNLKFAAGDGATLAGRISPLELLFRRASLQGRGIDPDCVACGSVIGDSMAPYIDPGDTIMWNTAVRNVIDGEVYVCRIDNNSEDHEGIVKRLYRLPGKKILVKSDNTSHPPFEVADDSPDFIIVGLVEWVAGWTRAARPGVSP